MDAAQAAAEAARRKVKRANGLLREVAGELTQLADGNVTTLGVLRAHDAASLQAAHDLTALGVAKHGAVDVIVIARPSRRAHPHHSPSNGAEEQTHASSNAGTQAHA